jgi:hypothetical protein
MVSPTGDASEGSNVKWVSNKIPRTPNIIPIEKTHFRCYERYKPNLSIISSGDPFAERVFL